MALGAELGGRQVRARVDRRPERAVGEHAPQHARAARAQGARRADQARSRLPLSRHRLTGRLGAGSPRDGARGDSGAEPELLLASFVDIAERIDAAGLEELERRVRERRRARRGEEES